jgi:chromate transporter
MYFCFFDAELVAKGLLTRTELIDAIVGQFTPGPVFSSVTVGYQINGIRAFISTLAIFLPSFVFVAIESYGKKMRNSKPFATFLML